MLYALQQSVFQYSALPSGVQICVDFLSQHRDLHVGQTADSKSCVGLNVLLWLPAVSQC